jgi:hypothetical protein
MTIPKYKLFLIQTIKEFLLNFKIMGLVKELYSKII